VKNPFPTLVLLSLPFWLGLGFFCCTTTASARVAQAQTALNVMTDIVDPAYEATRVGCDAAEVGAVALADAHKINIDELRGRIQETRARCDRVITIYERMIELQKAAREALKLAETGDDQALAQAEQQLNEIRALWNEKPAGSP
jgi:exonuclease VII small subunit